MTFADLLTPQQQADCTLTGVDFNVQAARVIQANAEAAANQRALIRANNQSQIVQALPNVTETQLARLQNYFSTIAGLDLATPLFPQLTNDQLAQVVRILTT